MKKICLKTLLLTVSFIFIASTSLVAMDTEETKSQHAPIRTHISSVTEELTDKELRAKEDQENVENQDQIPESEHPLCMPCQENKPISNENDETSLFACSGCKKSLTQDESEEFQSSSDDDKVTNGVIYYSSHPSGYHKVVSVSVDGGALETEDGAIYSVKWSDQNKTINWQPYHTILLTPNHSWFSSYAFKFINLETGEKAAVNMTLGPIYENINTHWIEAIDYEHRTIRLEDNSLWSMSWLDQDIVNTFDRYDVVIIGTNDGWWKGSNPNILIAVKSFKYARGAKTN